MILASAYPSSDISAMTMTIVAVVMTGSLAIWIALVYLAASERRERRGRDASGTITLAEAGSTADHESGGAERDLASQTRGAAA